MSIEIEVADLDIKNGGFQKQTVELPEGERWGTIGHTFPLSWNMARKTDDFHDLPTKKRDLYSCKLKTRNNWFQNICAHSNYCHFPRKR